jgi:mono/diheme cytochrome c family protein
MRLRLPVSLAIALLAAAACSDASRDGDAAAPAPTLRPSQAEPAAEPRDPAKLAARGKAVYGQVCIACHALDPTAPGAIGPPVAGSSLELLRAKVLHGEYPPGYAPKRDTRNMIPLPHLEPDLPALEAYLAQAAAGG